MPITFSDLGVSEDLGRRILVVARSIAPCLNTLEGEDQKDAIAILKGVAGEAKGRGSRHVANERIGPAAVTWREVKSWFAADDINGLRALCGADAPAPLPLGSFPKPSRVVSRLFPDDC